MTRYEAVRNVGFTTQCSHFVPISQTSGYHFNYFNATPYVRELASLLHPCYSVLLRLTPANWF
jgi:hypothetical protein